MAYTILRLSDGQHLFPFLYDGENIYCPDYNPTVYGKNPQYCLTMRLYDTGVHGVEGYSHINNDQHGWEAKIIFDHSEFLACKPFRHEGHNYQQVISMRTWHYRPMKYLCLQAWKGAELIDGKLQGGEADPDYTSVQSAGIVNTAPFTISVITNKYGVCIPGKKTELEEFFRANYAYPDSKITINAEVAVLDENDIYWQSSTYKKQGDYDFCFELAGWPFSMNPQWKDDLRIVGLLHVRIEHNIKDENDLPYRVNIDIRSNPYQLSETVFAQMLCTAQGTFTITGINDMLVNKPRIINKNLVQVVEMTAQTDSKSNIIQPVFFRTRELANLILHPEVTENVCINLDAYKAQVTQFFIKVEGVVFPEVGRTESGVIFHVQGNMLPGKVAGGSYYILNQDTDLVTTGKYIYEA